MSPLPDAPPKSPRVYKNLKTKTLEDVTFSNVEATGDPLSIEIHNEDELRRLVLVQLARLTVKSEWTGLLTGSSTSFPLTAPDGDAGNPQYTFASDLDTGLFRPGSDQIGFTMGGSNKLSFGSAGEILIGGSAAGTSGQVLTSGGSGSAMSWEDAASGGSSGILTDMTVMETTNDYFNVNSRIGGGNYSASAAVEYTQIICVPFIAPHTGTVDEVVLDITGTNAGEFAVTGFYTANATTGLPDTKIFVAEVPLDSTGQITQTSFTGTASLERGVTYWMCMVSSDYNNFGGTLRARENNPAFNAPSTIPTGRSIGSLFGNAPPNCITEDTSTSLPAAFTASNLKGNSRDLPDVVIHYA